MSVAPNRTALLDPAGFRARWPWRGGDLQTLRNVIAEPKRDLSPWPSERLWIDLGDGDALAAAWHVGRDVAKPAVLLIHGLTGCEDSAHVRLDAAFWLARGHGVLRLNLRGAVPSRPRCRGQYHAGRSGDVHRALLALPAAVKDRGLLAMGYSLGGNMLLKYLGEGGSRAGVQAACAVSAPIDLASSSRRIHAARNRVYHDYLLRRMKAEAVASPAQLVESERRAIAAAATIRAYDDVFVAPRNGFAGADDYYARSSALGFLGAIRVPTLVVHAMDDPWIPEAPYRAFDWSRNPALALALTPGGGHCGFHAADAPWPWHVRAFARFVERMA
jgi:predicted alpha/beta-fold hydrolase